MINVEHAAEGHINGDGAVSKNSHDGKRLPRAQSASLDPIIEVRRRCAERVHTLGVQDVMMVFRKAWQCGSFGRLACHEYRFEVPASSQELAATRQGGRLACHRIGPQGRVVSKVGDDPRAPTPWRGPQA